MTAIVVALVLVGMCLVLVGVAKVSAASFEKRLRRDALRQEERLYLEAALLAEAAEENDRRWYAAGGSRS